MANTPISFTAPKAVFDGAHQAKAGCGCRPRKYSTVSTMCSSTRGPASAPSLVTWPTSTMAVPLALAARVRCAAHSRTWATEPGARGELLGVHGLDGVNHRHMAGWVWPPGWRGFFRAESRPALSPASGPAPSRRERNATCAPDFLHRSHKAWTCPSAGANPTPAASSVDLPMPGSPPINTTPPSTMPPPSTRSSSSWPVGCAFHVGAPRCRPEHRDLGRLGQRGEAVFGRRRSTAGHGFDQRVPGVAVRAFAQPARAGAAAFVAGELGLFLGHPPRLTPVGCALKSGLSSPGPWCPAAGRA